MKRFIYILFLITAYLHSHELMMNVIDNKDNTVSIIAGETIEGAMIRFESLQTGEVIFKQRLPKESELTISIPNEPYQIVLDGGPGEKIVKGGVSLNNEILDKRKINPKAVEKLTKPEHEEHDFDTLTLALFLIAFMLFFLTIYFSAKNSNKIVALLKENN